MSAAGEPDPGKGALAVVRAGEANTPAPSLRKGAGRACIVIADDDKPVSREASIAGRVPGQVPGLRVTDAFFEPLPAVEMDAWRA